jgi:hydrogenase/urease accessory protein HupE
VLKFTLIVLSTLLATVTAQAHPGHGQPGEAFGLVHHLTEPIHVFAPAVVVLLVGALLRLRSRRMAARTIR